MDAVQDKYLRLKAEFENFRKRSAKERSDALGKSKARVIEVCLSSFSYLPISQRLKRGSLLGRLRRRLSMQCVRKSRRPGPDAKRGENASTAARSQASLRASGVSCAKQTVPTVRAVPGVQREAQCGVQDLLPVVDAFEAAAGQVKAETDGEQRIAASYQVRRTGASHRACIQCCGSTQLAFLYCIVNCVNIYSQHLLNQRI